jgi:hypothetical protein
MKTYTVLLLRPDYVADDYGTDTYMTHVDAPTVAAAQAAAQREAVLMDYSPQDEPIDEEEILEHMPDYAVLMVIEGKHMDIKEEQL